MRFITHAICLTCSGSLAERTSLNTGPEHLAIGQEPGGMGKARFRDGQSSSSSFVTSGMSEMSRHGPFFLPPLSSAKLFANLTHEIGDVDQVQIPTVRNDAQALIERLLYVTPHRRDNPLIFHDERLSLHCLVRLLDAVE
jgi:hypothetical protein